jgi:hypothetical protein
MAMRIASTAQGLRFVILIGVTAACSGTPEA